MDYFRIITLNSVHLLVYKNGDVFRIKDGNVKYIPNNQHKCGYNLIKLNRKLFYRHRIIAYCFLELNITDFAECIDHIDGNKVNNCVGNLRRVTRQENSFNNQHNVKGYSYQKRTKNYKTYIHLNRKMIYLGYFKTEEEAREAYLKAKEKYHIITKYSQI